MGHYQKKKIAILGFAFKSNTNDTRESAAIQICKDLLDEGAELIIHDPKVNVNQIESDLEIISKSKKLENKFINKKRIEGSWDFTDNIDKALINADAALILTEWKEYTNINWEEAFLRMRKPAWIFDSRSIIEPNKVLNSGLNFWRLGDGLI